MNELTRRQREIFDFLRDNYESFAHPPTLDQLCAALGMASRGSLYKHIMARNVDGEIYGDRDVFIAGSVLVKSGYRS